MAKKTVLKFVGGEYRPQRLASGLVGFRAPIDIQIAPGAVAAVDLKMTCTAMLVFRAQTIEPGENISVVLTNSSNMPLRYNAGEVIARAYPLFPTEFEIE